MFAIKFLYLEQGTILGPLVSILHSMNIKTERAYNEYCSSLKCMYIVESALANNHFSVHSRRNIFFSFFKKVTYFFTYV